MVRTERKVVVALREAGGERKGVRVRVRVRVEASEHCEDIGHHWLHISGLTRVGGSGRIRGGIGVQSYSSHKMWGMGNSVQLPRDRRKPL